MDESRRACLYQVTTEVPSVRNFLITLSRPLDSMPARAGESVQAGYLEQLRIVMNRPLIDAAAGDTVVIRVKEVDPASGKAADSSVNQLRLALGACAGEVLIVPDGR